MPTINPGAAANREQARRSDGKFGTTTHAEQGTLGPTGLTAGRCSDCGEPVDGGRDGRCAECAQFAELSQALERGGGDDDGYVYVRPDDDPTPREMTTTGGRPARMVEADCGFTASVRDGADAWQRIGVYGTEAQARSAIADADDAQAMCSECAVNPVDRARLGDTRCADCIALVCYECGAELAEGEGLVDGCCNGCNGEDEG